MEESIKRPLKVVGFIFLIVFIFLTSFLFCLKLYGKTILENALTNLLDIKIQFNDLQIDIKNYSGQITGINISPKNNPDKPLFYIDRFYMRLDKDSLLQKKDFVVEEIIIDKAIINITRDETNQISILKIKPIDNLKKPQEIVTVNNSKPTVNKPTDYCEYISKIKKVSFTNSIVTFTDNFVANGPVYVKADEVNLEFNVGPKEELSIPINLNLTLNIPQDYLPAAGVGVSLKGKVYPNNINYDINIETKGFNIIPFNPYFKAYAPFYFVSGVFNSSTQFYNIAQNINALTTMVFEELNLVIKPGMEGNQFLETSINKLAPYLQSGSGGLIFDFVIAGTFSHPQFGIGPQVQTALGLAVMNEVNNFIRYIPR